MIKLIAIDMDGTLVDQRRELPIENVKAIINAQEKGVTVVVATGRDYTEAVKPLKDAGIRCPIICVNGAETRYDKGEIIDSVPLAKLQFQKVEEILNRQNIYFEIYTTKGAFTNNQELALQVVIDYVESTGFQVSKEEAIQIAERRFQNGEITYIDSFNELVNGVTDIKIHKVLAFTREDKARLLAKQELETEADFAVSSSANDNIEISNINAQKGIALKRFAKDHGILMEEVMAIGDNFNDVSMLKLAGVSVAMGNAELEIKEMCSYITKTNDDNGVAYAINKFIKENR